MADSDTSHKRKYEDESTPPPRRSTRFPALIESDAPPSYNSVPPLSQEFHHAKKQVEELASHALNADSKRSKFDNGSFDQKPVAANNQVGNGLSIPSPSYAGSKIIEVPNGRVGAIIGKAGETIKYLQNQSGARIQITRDAEHDPNMLKRTVELLGNQDQIAKAEQMIYDVLAEVNSGAPGSMLRRSSGVAGSESFSMSVPSSRVGLVIGKGGETIQGIQARSGARVQVIPLLHPPGDTSNERKVQIHGASEQIELAKQLINDVVQNRQQNPPMLGGYSQQGYQAQSQMNWAPQPPQMQQPGGYGYMQQQSGPYAGAPTQYMSQPPYPGYPPQPTSGGYTQNWGQSNPSNTQQVPPQGTGYDYYSQQVPAQQQPSSGPMTGGTTGYNYNQPPSGGYGQQGHSQNGYGSGGYNSPPAQPGYGQLQVNPQSGYGYQQSYGSTAGYGGGNNPPPGYGTQGETGQGAHVNPGYPTQGSNQAGYGGGNNPPPGGDQPSYGMQSETGQGAHVNPGYPTQGSNPASYGDANNPPSGGHQPSYGAQGETSQGAQVNPAYPTQGSNQIGYGTPAPVQRGYGPGHGPPQGQGTSNPPAYGQPGQTPSQGGGYTQTQPSLGQHGYPPSQPTAQSEYPPVPPGYGQPDTGASRAVAASPASNGGATTHQSNAYPPPYGAPPPVAPPGYGQQPPPYYSGGYPQQHAYRADGYATGATPAPAPPSQPAGQPNGAVKTSP